MILEVISCITPLIPLSSLSPACVQCKREMSRGGREATQMEKSECGDKEEEAKDLRFAHFPSHFIDISLSFFLFLSL